MTWSFAPSRHEANVANIVGAVVTLSCLAVCLVTIAVAAWLYHDKTLRHHFNKTSTELLFVSLLLMLPFSLGYASTNFHFGKSESAMCDLGMIIVIFTFNVTNWLQCCICLNLVMALKWPGVFRYNLKRWYYITSILVSVILAVLPTAFNEVHWNTVTASCWLDNPSDGYSSWQLGTLEFPILLVTVFMFASAGIVGRSLYQAHRNGKSQSEILNQLYEPTYSNGVDDLRAYPDTELSSRFAIEELVFEKAVQSERMRTDSRNSKVDPAVVRSWYSPRFPGSIGRSSGSSNVSRSLWKSRASNSWSASKNTNLNGSSKVLENKEEIGPQKVRVARMPMTANFGQDPRAEDARELRTTVLRISCYPVIHLLLSIISPIGSLLLGAAQHSSEGYKFGLYLLTYIGTAWLPLAYVICFLFADSSLHDAWVEKCRGSLDESLTDLEAVLGRNKHRLSGLQIRPQADQIHTHSPIVSAVTEEWNFEHPSTHFRPVDIIYHDSVDDTKLYEQKTRSVSHESIYMQEAPMPTIQEV